MLSLRFGPTLTSVHNWWKAHSFDCTDLCQSLSRFVIAFLLQSKRLLILWLQSPSTVILEPKETKFVTVFNFSSSICHEVMGIDAIILVFLNVEF